MNSCPRKRAARVNMTTKHQVRIRLQPLTKAKAGPVPTPVRR
jgi:hypothetical protein